MNLETKLHKSMAKLYEIPVSFWQRILGANLHFHLGHFIAPDTTLEDSMVIAVKRLAMQISPKQVSRVLDIGCGWGGPAFELAKMWKAEVVGLTISNRQTNYINRQARVHSLPVQAIKANVEEYCFDNIGAFDILWLYEVLEHIINRRALFDRLHHASVCNTHLAITMSCRAAQVQRQSLYSEFLGVQPLESASELVDMLEQTGWDVIAITDCTALTLPVWGYWAENLKLNSLQLCHEQVEKLSVEFSALGELYRKGMIQSIQIVSKRCSHLPKRVDPEISSDY